MNRLAIPFCLTVALSLVPRDGSAEVAGAPADFTVSLADSLQKVLRTGKADEYPPAQEVKVEAAADESESFQLIVVPRAVSLDKVQVKIEATDERPHAPVVGWRRVGYVKTFKPKYPTQHVGWWPDPLFPPGDFSVAKDERQPLWFKVNVPPEAARDYHYRITILHGPLSVTIPLKVHVWKFRLPRPGTLTTSFGIYANSVSDWYSGSDAKQAAMSVAQYQRWCAFLGEYRLAAKNLPQEFLKHGEAAAADADRATDKATVKTTDMSAIAPIINDVARLNYAPWSMGVYRLPSAPAFANGKSPKDAARLAAPVRGRVDEWLHERFPSQVYVYGIDEPPASLRPLLCDTYRLIKQQCPGVRILQTRDHAKELVGLVDIWCPLSPQADAAFFAERRKAGDSLWVYVCCSPIAPYANFFVDEPAIDHRVLFWQTRRVGASGFLYWNMTSWNGLPRAVDKKGCFPDVPIDLAQHEPSWKQKTNGDGFLIYPGPDLEPWPSIRLEVIRDGIEDYEYMGILARLVTKSRKAGKLPESLLEEADALSKVPPQICRSFKVYGRSSEELIKRRHDIAEMIERLNSSDMGPAKP